jgi:hypothetical protein
MTIVHKQLGIAAVAVAATALVFGASFALAQTAAELEAELNAASAQIDNNTSFDVNVKALGTQADVSAQVGVNTDAQTEYANLFGNDDTAMDAGMEEDTTMDVDADASLGVGARISAFFSAIADFFLGWW